MFESKYQAIRLWGQMLGSFPYYIEREQREAEAAHAPLDVIYERSTGDWVRLCDIENTDAKHKIYDQLLSYHTRDQ
jgi:hypothetical protein